MKQEKDTYLFAFTGLLLNDIVDYYQSAMNDHETMHEGKIMLSGECALAIFFTKSLLQVPVYFALSAFKIVTPGK
jgi:hypothetical protein